MSNDKNKNQQEKPVVKHQSEVNLGRTQSKGNVPRMENPPPPPKKKDE